MAKIIFFTIFAPKIFLNINNANFRYCIVKLPLVPLRMTADERSEMVSQLLFGEILEIMEMSDNWVKIRNLTDNYVGFADRKMLTVLTENNFEMQKKLYPVKISVPVATIYNATKQAIIITYGSTLWLNEENNCFLDNEKYVYSATDIADLMPVTSQEITRNAKKFLFAPYLWGGKSIFGVDCSGLTQLVFANLGIDLSRDAAQQVEKGTEIALLSAAQEGDLAFFENGNKKIIHVGILLNNRQIIHASGCVKIELIDENGIISAQNSSEYTHKLFKIKRIL